MRCCRKKVKSYRKPNNTSAHIGIGICGNTTMLSIVRIFSFSVNWKYCPPSNERRQWRWRVKCGRIQMWCWFPANETTHKDSVKNEQHKSIQHGKTKCNHILKCKTVNERDAGEKERTIPRRTCKPKRNWLIKNSSKVQVSGFEKTSLLNINYARFT